MVPPHPTAGISQLGLSHRCCRWGFREVLPGQGSPTAVGQKMREQALTRLIDRFAHLHHLAVQLHPQRCKERQMRYLASCQDTSFFLKVRHTSLAALSRVLLSVTRLLSALKMLFSNTVKEEWVI